MKIFLYINCPKLSHRNLNNSFAYNSYLYVYNPLVIYIIFTAYKILLCTVHYLRPTRIDIFIDEETEIPDPTGSKMKGQGF